MKTQPHSQTDFKGFGDFVEVFRAGTHTDSQGNKQSWTTADLDQMVANHQPTPIVIGHPKTNHPAYGWTEQLQRVGNVLQAKFTQVEPQFSKLVEDGRFKNRSVRIVKTDKGLALGHVGFLGAVPPAIEGLAPIEFNQSGESFDFEFDSRTPSLLAMMMRNMREFLIAKFSVEDADKVMPNWQIDDLIAYTEQQRLADIAEEASEPLEPSATNVTPSQFSKENPVTDNTKPTAAELAAQQQVADFAQQNKTLQQQLDEERKKNRRIADKAVIDAQIARGVKPALLEGAADFMMALSDETNSFEFAQGTGDTATTIKTNQRDYFKDLLNHLPAAVKFGETDFSHDVETVAHSDFSMPQGATVNPEQLALRDKALDYQRKNGGDFVTAYKAIGGK